MSAQILPRTGYHVQGQRPFFKRSCTQLFSAGAGQPPMKTLFLPALLGPALLLVAPAHAQRAFQVGPTGGLTLATAYFGEENATGDRSMPLRAGFLAGATANWQSQGHWGVRLASLYVQQGYTQRYTYLYSGVNVEQVRLNYLRLPLQVSFSQRPGGQGIQAFAGPYAGVLLGGRYTFESSYPGSSYARSGRVVVADTHQEAYPILFSSTSLVPDSNYYSRRFDVGVQGGLGYRLGNALLQVGYTLGLRNLSTTTLYELGGTTTSWAGTPYRTRSLEASLTYLLGLAH
jgi:hypothetical protein